MTDRSVVYRLRAELGSFQASMAQASASTRKLGTDMTSLSKEGEKSRKGLASVGKAAGLVGAVAAAGLGAAVLKAADFDKSMSNVQAATRETSANMDRLREAALKAGADTAFSASEAADAIKELSFAGISTEDILGGGLTGALDLAAAGSLDVGEAASFAASAMNQFQLSGSDIPHVADLLAGAASNASGEVGDYGAALNQAGLVSAQFGLTIEETMGTLAAMGSAGFIGSDAGTSLKTFLQALVPASDQAATAMAEMGFSAFDAQGNFVGMTDVAKQLSDGLGDMSEQQRNATLKTIFGADAVRAAGLIYEQGGKGMASWIDKTDQSGVAAEQAAAKLDNLAGDWTELTGSIETALIGTGEGAQGPLRSLVQGATKLTNAFVGLSPAAMNTTAALLGVTAVLGGGLWFTTKVVSGITATQTALAALGIQANVTKTALKNIGAGVVGLTAIIVTADLAQAAIERISDTSIDTSGLTRDLEALADDRITGNLDNLFHTFQDIQNETEHDWNPLTWVSGFDPSGFENAKNGIKGIDEALAGMVESGDAESAAAAIENMAPAAHKAGLSTAELAALFPGYQTALKNSGEAAAGAAGKTDKMASALDGAGGSMTELSAMTEEEAKALKKSRDAATATAKEFFGLGEKLDNAKVSLREWIRDLEKQAAALRDFQHNAEVAGRKGLSEGLIAALEEAGPAGALRMKQLANATEAEIARANKAWRSGQKAVNDYTDTVGGVPPANIKVNNDPALIGIKEVEKRLREIKDKTVTVRITASGTAALTPGFGVQGGFAGGGWTGPGGKYQPKGVVHGDEYVFSKEATHGNVAMLERLHHQLRGYAQGGLVQRHAAPVMSTGGGRLEIDYQRLAQTLATVRPLYGDVHLSGDDSFRRELRADRRRAGLGGV